MPVLQPRDANMLYQQLVSDGRRLIDVSRYRDVRVVDRATVGMLL